MSEAGTALPRQFDDSEQRRAAARTGMWIFLATEILFFGVMFFGYTATRIHFPDAFAAASRHTDVVLGSINTAVLLTSSLTVALAVLAAKNGDARRTTRLLVATLLLGVVFMAIKGTEYYHEYQEHLVPALDFAFPAPHTEGARLFFWLYFVMTGFHALHLTIGIAVVAVIAVLAHRRAFDAAYHTPVEVTGLYWHLIDIVWIFLYPLFYLLGHAGP